MHQRFGYSLDGTNFRGSFSTRREARLAAFDTARQQADPPAVVFVARIRGMDPQASGHAKGVIRDMRWRHRDVTGDTTYLDNLSQDVVQDLDRELAKTILAWLDRHKLLRHEHRVDAISEYPVPASQNATIGQGVVIEGYGQEREVQEMA